MNKPRIIGIMGKAGSGKSVVAEYLMGKFGYDRSRFSDTLKNMLRCVPGVTDDMIEGHLKEVPNMLLGGHTPRKVMQTLGTEWGRELVSTNFWVDCWSRTVVMNGCEDFVSVEDVRFPNELEAVRDLGGVIWQIKRPMSTDILTSNHQSETMMNNMKPDAVLHNSGDTRHLFGIIDDLMLKEYDINIEPPFSHHVEDYKKHIKSSEVWTAG